MIKKVPLFVLLGLFTLVFSALAQEAAPDAPAGLDLIHQLVVAIVPTLTLVVVQLVKKLVAAVPNEWLPIIAPVVGMLIEGASQALGLGAPTGGLANAAIAGAAATGLHQVYRQQTK